MSIESIQNIFIQESIWIVETVNCIRAGVVDCAGTFVRVNCHKDVLSLSSLL